MIKVILCASEHVVTSYDIASEALNNFKKIHYILNRYWYKQESLYSKSKQCQICWFLFILHVIVINYWNDLLQLFNVWFCLYIPCVSPQHSKRPVLLQHREGKSNLTAVQYEQQLLSPGNFVKNPCIVKVVQKTYSVV